MPLKICLENTVISLQQIPPIFNVAVSPVDLDAEALLRSPWRSRAEGALTNVAKATLRTAEAVAQFMDPTSHIQIFDLLRRTAWFKSK